MLVCGVHPPPLIKMSHNFLWYMTFRIEGPWWSLPLGTTLHLWDGYHSVVVLAVRSHFIGRAELDLTEINL